MESLDKKKHETPNILFNDSVRFRKSQSRNLQMNEIFFCIEIRITLVIVAQKRNYIIRQLVNNQLNESSTLVSQAVMKRRLILFVKNKFFDGFLLWFNGNWRIIEWQARNWLQIYTKQVYTAHSNGESQLHTDCKMFELLLDVYRKEYTIGNYFRYEN